MLTLYEHGGNVYHAAKILNVSISEILDFSSNVLPFHILDNVLSKEQIETQELLKILTKLPEPYSESLKLKLSKKLNLSEQNISIGSGTTEFIQIICSLYRGKNAHLFIPTYGDYEKFLYANAANINFTVASETNNFVHKLDIKNNVCLENVEVLFLCNPNNPTGSLLHKEEILYLINTFKNTLFVMDESYMPFVKNFQKYSLINTNAENLIILNSFSKAYGLPGLRLGWVYSCNKQLINKIISLQSAWPISSLSQILGNILLDHSMDLYIEKLQKNKGYLYKNLLPYKGIKIFKSTTNFFMFKYLRNNPEKFYNFFFRNKILLRNLENIRGLNNNYFRISISTIENIDYFLNILKEYIQIEM
jgi:threonine-phosphate decarboxylase